MNWIRFLRFQNSWKNANQNCNFQRKSFCQAKFFENTEISNIKWDDIFTTLNKTHFRRKLHLISKTDVAPVVIYDKLMRAIQSQQLPTSRVKLVEMLNELVDYFQNTPTTVLNKLIKDLTNAKEESAIDIFHRMKQSPNSPPDAYTYTTIIQHYFLVNNAGKALDLWQEMIEKNIKPTPVIGQRQEFFLL